MTKTIENFYIDKHIEYIDALDKTQENTLEYQVTEHLRMSAIYWALCALHLMGSPDRLGNVDVIQFVRDCWDENKGAYSGNIMHDAHLLYTLSAVQILALCGKLREELPIGSEKYERVVKFVCSLQQEDGSWIGDEFGEVDTRFVYCGFNCLRLLNALDRIDVEKSIQYLLSCQNFDGGFGVSPGAESHAGQIFCCVSALNIVGAIPRMGQDKIDLLGWWLCERQCENGGLNGRPEKLADVCYSWWVLSSLTSLQRLDWMNREALIKFIINCQDPEGGISDKPDNMVDVFHTYFGIAGISLMDGDERLLKIDPVYALPINILKELGIQTFITNHYVNK